MSSSSLVPAPAEEQTLDRLQCALLMGRVILMINSMRINPHRRLTVLAAFTGLMLTAGLATSASAATVPAPAAGQGPGSVSTVRGVGIFYQQANRRLGQKGGGFTSDLGGVLTSGPAGIAITERPPDENRYASWVFARGADNGIWYRYFNPGFGDWEPWRSLGGRATGAPGVTCFGDVATSLRVVYVRGTDGRLWRQAASVTGWTSLGGRLLSDPAGLAARAGTCPDEEHVFAIGVDRAVWERVTSGWRRVGGQSTVTPAAIVLATGEVDLFVRGTDNALWMNTRDPGSSVWGGWQRVGGKLASAVTAAVDTSAAVTRVVVALGADGNLWQGRNVVGSPSWSWSQIR